MIRLVIVLLLLTAGIAYAQMGQMAIVVQPAPSGSGCTGAMNGTLDFTNACNVVYRPLGGAS